MADHIILMKEGEVMQEGAPSQMYDHPKNLFVAGFLGTPQINTFDCALQKTPAGGLAFAASDFTLPVPNAMAQQVKPALGKPVVLGVRPSDFSLAAPGDPTAIAGTVDSVELLGDAYLVYVKVGEQVIIAKLNQGAAVGGPILLRADPQKLHVFDKETEARIND